ncbi:Oxidoreductase molybdopterin binding domain [Slackia heliotrinireducens]|uniref:Sulfite oxidase-like oxidoreductase n=1 Tax=Slackia heliotrinireducens (strain ATCC 29202 / DSM 20476 / NCTC 11029 / RHS 1) TaxID=471855 RepID=C7N713_SLAHD|nr:molybdopterin-dependent oxidoreductase [Slackia heliotrinireducens]ACV22698.1 sulfite oxidase-like oxidoreductase [Slackia heliotrinireducens DSM 20476]VEH01302.1 Oxidoreductase molybdopterin binding domain [Slackia heliotrinireducens]
MSRKKKLFALGATALLAGALCAVGCAQTEAENPDDASSVVIENPAVFVDDDGDLIQLAPFDDRTNAAWYQQDPFKQFNTNYLHADQRGCKSCHSDLADLVWNSEYYHPGRYGLNVEWTVQTCRGCHSTSGYGIDITEDNKFGDIMHATHMNVETECWSCHATSSSNLIYDSDTEGTMLLWEDARTEELRGFTDIASDDMDGEFTYNQDLVMDVEDLPSIDVQFYEWDYKRIENEANDVPLDAQMMKDWTITMSGKVKEEKTWNLQDLIDDPNVPKETKVVKWHCVLNAFGGNVIGQAEVTGIPYSWLIEQCGGLTEDANGIENFSADGFSDGASVPLELVTDGTALVVYEVNGEPLTWSVGYPCFGMAGGTACGSWAKQLSDIVVTGPETPFFNMVTGRPASADENDTLQYNNPNVGIIGLKDGQVVQAGEPLTIQGYADAFDKEITAVELSFDRGATWKTFPVSGTDLEKLLIWEYTFTPDAGSYYVEARAVNSDGKTSSLNFSRMFTAVEDIDSVSAVPAADAEEEE